MLLASFVDHKSSQKIFGSAFNAGVDCVGTFTIYGRSGKEKMAVKEDALRHHRRVALQRKRLRNPTSSELLAVKKAAAALQSPTMLPSSTDCKALCAAIRTPLKVLAKQEPQGPPLEPAARRQASQTWKRIAQSARARAAAAEAALARAREVYHGVVVATTDDATAPPFEECAIILGKPLGGR